MDIKLNFITLTLMLLVMSYAICYELLVIWGRGGGRLGFKKCHRMKGKIVHPIIYLNPDEFISINKKKKLAISAPKVKIPPDDIMYAMKTNRKFLWCRLCHRWRYRGVVITLASGAAGGSEVGIVAAPGFESGNPMKESFYNCHQNPYF